jgi:hypothetical protein
MEEEMPVGHGHDTERGYEIGKDEAWFANVKRTYDEYQHESLETIRRDRDYTSKVLGDAQQNDNTRQNIANQALQNAVETANMVGKQAVRHGDVAIDRQWNVDEVSALTAKSGVEADAIIAAIVGKVVQELSAKGKL